MGGGGVKDAVEDNLFRLGLSSTNLSISGTSSLVHLLDVFLSNQNTQEVKNERFLYNVDKTKLVRIFGIRCL